MTAGVNDEINSDVLRALEEQLKELNQDNSNQTLKTSSLLWFFWAISAIVFSQEGLSNVPWFLLWIIFTLSAFFIVISVISYQWIKVRAITELIHRKEDNKWQYLENRINSLQRCKKNMLWIIDFRDKYNTMALVVFWILILVLSFIYLGYMPMNSNWKTSDSLIIYIQPIK